MSITTRLMYHVGSSLMMYCSLVGVRACDQSMYRSSGSTEYNYFHTYIFAWILGLNLVAAATWNFFKTSRR